MSEKRKKGLFAGLLELLGEDDDTVTERGTDEHPDRPSDHHTPGMMDDRGDTTESVAPEPQAPPAEDDASPTPGASVRPQHEASPPPSEPRAPDPSPRPEPTPGPPSEPSPGAAGPSASNGEAAAGPPPAAEPAPSRPASDPLLVRLTVPDVAERRSALRDVLASGLDPYSAEAVGERALNDPAPDVRLAALEGLSERPELTGADVLRLALQDPADEVRAGAVRLAAAQGADRLPDIAKLVALDRWPATQRVALRVLPRLIGEATPDEQLTLLLGSVGGLDPSAVGGAREDFTRLARAIGRERLVGVLGSGGAARLGAIRLLLEEGSTEALKAVADLKDDETDEVRVAAALASSLLARPRSDGAEARNATPPADERMTTRTGTSRTEERRPSQGHEDLGAEVISGLARALSDPDEAVRTRARETLERADRDRVRRWVHGSLVNGSADDAGNAARVVEALRLVGAAGRLLERAAGLPAASRSDLVRALGALDVDAQTMATMAREVEASRRHEALRLVWHLQGEGVLPHLREFLADSSGPIRLAALEIIGDSGNPDAPAVAHRILERDSSPAVRAAAVKILGSADADQRLLALSQALGDPDPDVRATAVEALLGSVPSREASQLALRAAEDPDDRVRDAALHHLAALGSDDDPVLWAALRGSGDRQRETLLAMLEGHGADRLAGLATQHLDSANPDERALAVEIAGRAGTPECVRQTIGALSDPTPRVRRTAAAALAVLRSPESIPALGRALKDPNPKVRIEAVHALGMIDDDEVIPVLITALKDPEVRVRDQAGAVLERWSSPGVARKLVEALGSPDLARSAAELIGRMGRSAVEPLVDMLLADGDGTFVVRVGELLAEIVGPETFLDELSSLDPVARLRATEALGAMGGPRSVDGLIRCLSDPDERIRTRALQHLGRLGDPRAYEAVRRAFTTDPVLEVVEAAETALRELEPDPEG